MSNVIYMLIEPGWRSIMIQPKILVTGATGKTGSAVVALLRQRDVPIRAVVRRRDDRSRALEAQGVEVAIADPLDPQQMRGALRGATRAYYLPPFHSSMLEAATIFASAARDTGLEAIVALSQWLASPDHPAWLTRQLWHMEQLFGQLPGGSTIIAPPFFADNYLRLISFAAHLGVLPSLTGDSRNAPPSTEDIAAVAVAALLDPGAHAGRHYCPTGPALLSTSDMARILGRILNRRVRRFEMPMWLFLKAARMQGVSQDELSGFRYWVEDHRQGAFAFNLPIDDVLRVTGRAPEGFETAARRYAALPDARRSLRADAKAFADFMRTPLSPGYDLDRFDRERNLVAPTDARFAMQNPEWRAERTLQATGAYRGVHQMLGEAA
ncbi:NAD-dependent epimerase/dehydratase family protein [Sphingomonas koreensis]|nr:NAD-dependent epimerase/dehydratase family protein [Sphingomonas koreensis]